MKTYVLYHANCWDGFCAAWIARREFVGEVEFIPVQYGQEPPAIAGGSSLYILDFSYSREQLHKWWDIGTNAVRKLVVLDHHKTAKDELWNFEVECEADGRETPRIRFDMEKSGASLTWEYFHPLEASPWIVDYTEDRDLWRWKLPNSREINAYLRSWPLDFAKWDDFDQIRYDSPEWGGMIEGGTAILRRERQMIDDHLRHAREIVLGGHKVMAVNATVLFSEIAGELAKDRPFGVCYFDRADGKRQWSLRSRDDGVDVATIAKRFGGGGHRNAAGFEDQPFLIQPANA